MPSRLSIVALVAVLAACGGDDDSPAPTDAGGGGCSSNADCDDGIFCNGAERCAPSDEEADEQGCAPASTSPCGDGTTCEEATTSCVSCSVNADGDGDGVEAASCGGNDCDDADANRFPGNTEICDPDGHDEDCDDSTLGGDEDEDGYAPIECCNGARCGRDCDDTRDSVSPEGTEACNGIDEDCDGDLDEGARELFFRDLDGDGFGDNGTQIMRACSEDPLFVRAGDDCDDRDRLVFPGAVEICDGKDNDCNPSTEFDADLDRDGHLPADAPCTGDDLLPRDDCDDTDSLVFAGSFERCNGVDDDCDGSLDESAMESGANAWCTERARSAGDMAVSAVCGSRGSSATCVINTCADGQADCDGVLANGCEESLEDDPRNCGACGVSCLRGDCVDGQCEAGFAADEPLVKLITIEDGVCGLSADGTALCWGKGGVLVRGPRPSPVLDQAGDPVTDVIDIAGSDSCACLIQDPNDDGMGQLSCMGIVESTGAEQGLCRILDLDGGSVLFNLLEVSGWDDVRALSTGEDFGCALRGAEGDVYCWGVGGSVGGDGTDALTPTQVLMSNGSPLSGVDQIASGTQNTCAIRGGEVWCWGSSNGNGQLGRGHNNAITSTGHRAHYVGGVVEPASKVEVGNSHVCALGAGGALSCWGDNEGHSVTFQSDFPTMTMPVMLPTSLGMDSWTWLDVAVSTRGRRGHTCAVRDRAGVEEIVCWGINTVDHTEEAARAPAGGCPDVGGDPMSRDACPIELAGFWNVNDARYARDPAELIAGRHQACILKAGRPWCWGRNVEGILGNPNTSLVTSVAIPTPRNAPLVKIESSEATACAIDESGATVCWGRNRTGIIDPSDDGGSPPELLLDTATTGWPGPVTGARDISVASSTACALLADRSVWCWGGFDGVTNLGLLQGQDQAPMPMMVSGLSDVVDIEIGGYHGCARTSDDSVLCWGESQEGATGNAAPADACGLGACDYTPHTVEGIDGEVAELAVGGFPQFGLPGFSCARLTDGGVSCWGGSTGLGDGSMLGEPRGGRPTPARVGGIDDAIALRASEAAVCALRANGQLWCWGNDLGGTLGTRELERCGLLAQCAPEPVRSNAVRDVVDFAMSLARTCATTADGRVWCWGGQGIAEGLDDTGPIPRAPVPAIAYPNQLTVAGSAHCGLVAGDVLCWGANPITAHGRSGITADAAVSTPIYAVGL